MEPEMVADILQKYILLSPDDRDNLNRIVIIKTEIRCAKLSAIKSLISKISVVYSS